MVGDAKETLCFAHAPMVYEAWLKFLGIEKGGRMGARRVDLAHSAHVKERMFKRVERIIKKYFKNL